MPAVRAANSVRPLAPRHVYVAVAAARRRLRVPRVHPAVDPKIICATVAAGRCRVHEQPAFDTVPIILFGNALQHLAGLALPAANVAAGHG
ncbi:MAG TPA: hypothetical protein VF681_13335 [Abditibacteriaceae bacterium]